jgi:hypothetical protein
MMTSRKITFAAFLFLCFVMLSMTGFAQKGKKNQKLDKRKFDIEIKETTVEGKKYEKDVFEFSPKEIISDYFETKFKVPTMHYKTLKDSTYTEDGDELKYFKVAAVEKSGKADEEYHLETVVAGREITGKIMLMKGDVVKRTWEFEGTQNN